MPHRLRRVLLCLLLVGICLPITTHGQVDQRCFSENDCLSARQGVATTDAEQRAGFIRNSETAAACGDKDAAGRLVGFCLPTTQTTTKIGFGGKRDFQHLGDFIQYMYRYAIIIAGILGVVMVIRAGFSWITSGGSSDSISKAKQQIANAVIGITLAVLSYAVLNTINPYLVNLRLPQVWLINTQGLVRPFCDQLEGKKIAPLPAGTQASNLTYEQTSQLLSGPTTTPPNLAQCGKRYVVEGGGSQSCTGLACQPGYACVGGQQNAGENGYVCIPGMLVGTISAPSGLCSNNTGNIIDNDLKLIAMCKDGNAVQVAEIDVPDNGRQYAFPQASNLKSVCGTETNLAGFYLGAEINDETGGFGAFCQGSTLASGCDDFHAIGRQGPGSHECSANLAKIYNSKTGAADCTGPNGVKHCSCGAISAETKIRAMANDVQFVENHLISLADLSKDGGFSCNITVNRIDFPALENGVLSCEFDNSKCSEEQFL